LLEDRYTLSTLSVLNAQDNGPGSLREAVKDARDGDTIVFAPSVAGQTIALTSSQLTITKSLTIQGPGASLLAVSGSDQCRVFEVRAGFSVSITGLTITHGWTKDKAGGGGILSTNSALALADVVLSANRADPRGGAVSNLGRGVFRATDCAFVGNLAGSTSFAEGGAVFDDNTGTSATFRRCSFVDNQAIGADGSKLSWGEYSVGLAGGGALHNEGVSTMTVLECTFSGNRAVGGSGAEGLKDSTFGFYVLDSAHGGAIANHDGGTLVVSRCRFTANQAIGGSGASTGGSGPSYVGLGFGGALESEGPATVTDSSFTGNEALGGGGNRGGSGAILAGAGAGGAIGNDFFDVPNPMTVRNCTFTDNRAAGGAGNTGGAFVGAGLGGGFANCFAATATISQSTFTRNRATGGAGRVGQSGAPGLGGALANIDGSILAVNDCTLTDNVVSGGNGGTGGNGGNGLGGGICNDGLSTDARHLGVVATLTVTASTITTNRATGGAAGAGGSTGQGIGGGAYFATNGDVCLDAATLDALFGNLASTSNHDLIGDFTVCP
jgi:hypothetical protein